MTRNRTLGSWRVGPGRRLLGIAALAVVTLSVAPSVGASLAAAAPRKVSTVDLLAGATVKAKGASWFLEVGFDSGLGVGQQDLTVALLRTVKSPFAFEDHTWNFVVPLSSASFSTTTGKGSIDVPTQAKPIATVKLNFSETSKKAVACTSGSEEMYDLSVSGTATLDTGTGPEWAGTVKGTSWKGVANEITVDSGCVPNVNIGCANAKLAASGAPTGSTTELLASSGSIAGGENDVAVIRTTKLSAPSGATRTDVVADYVSKTVLLAYDTATRTMKVTTPASALVHGSATLVASKVFSLPNTCTVGKTKYKRVTTFGEPAKYSGSISAKPVLGGTMTAPKSTTTGTFEVVAVTKI